MCNVDTGESCQCRNNTETNCESKDEADCWEYQVSPFIHSLLATRGVGDCASPFYVVLNVAEQIDCGLSFFFFPVIW